MVEGRCDCQLTMFPMQLDVDMLKVTSNERSQIPKSCEAAEEWSGSRGKFAGSMPNAQVQDPGRKETR